jgi:enoyl-CoA hydratase/carnithine racemase
MPTLTTTDGDIVLLDLGADENKLNRTWLDELDGCLDHIVASPPAAVVTTATGKFWATGLDLDWMGANPDAAQVFLDDVERVLAKVLLLPTTAVAAIQGHAFAAGAMLALAHDVRVMRADRGFFCLPEADINIPFTEGMTALIMSKLTPAAATEAMITARRYGGEDALAAGLVDAVADEDALLAAAIERARGLAAKDGPTLGTIKQRMYAAEVEVLLDRSGNPFA